MEERAVAYRLLQCKSQSMSHCGTFVDILALYEVLSHRLGTIGKRSCDTTGGWTVSGRTHTVETAE